MLIYVITHFKAYGKEQFSLPMDLRHKKRQNNPIREGEKGAGAVSVGSRLFSRFARVLLACMLAWASLYGAKKHMAKHVARPSSPSIARKSDFCPKKEVRVARPQRETRILIENGNQVARPPCQTFHSLKKETLWRDLPATIFVRRVEIQHNVI